jgi:hypothetical protein
MDHWAAIWSGREVKCVQATNQATSYSVGYPTGGKSGARMSEFAAGV